MSVDSSFQSFIDASPEFDFLQSATDRIHFADHLIRQLPIVVVDRDDAGRIRWASDPALLSTGYKTDELIGQSIETLVPEKYRPHHAELRREFNSKPVLRPMGTRSTLSCRRRDGSKFPCEVILIPSTIAGESVVICLIINMSEREL